jgi:acyl-CoA thioesterase-2
MFDLQAHGPDTFVGTGPRYPWGGLYGGQIVAQALRAAASSVDPVHEPHSIRADFIRPGDHTEPVRYEVDRIRNGRSFLTRRVVARQAIGAILNAECSFQKPESSVAMQTVPFPTVPRPDGLVNTSFSEHFDRRFVEHSDVIGAPRDGAGRVAAWMRVLDDLGQSAANDEPFLHQCWFAYVSDDLASDTVRSAHSTVYDGDPDVHLPGISLDHTVWFHRPMYADRWHLHDFTCHHYTGARGLAIGHVFDESGVHVATIAQEVLLREPRVAAQPS